jgi:hypothetical protein
LHSSLSSLLRGRGPRLEAPTGATRRDRSEPPSPPDARGRSRPRRDDGVVRSAPISRRTVIGLVAAIAVTDVVANMLAPEDAVSGEACDRGGLPSGPVVGAPVGRVGAREHVHVRDGLRIGGLRPIGVTILVLVAVPGSRSYFDNRSVAADSTCTTRVAAAVLIPLGTVVFEELIFRGVLLAVLQRQVAHDLAGRELRVLRVLAPSPGSARCGAATAAAAPSASLWARSRSRRLRGRRSRGYGCGPAASSAGYGAPRDQRLRSWPAAATV